MTVTVSSPVFSKNASFVKVVISRNLGTSGHRAERTECGKSAHSHWQTVSNPAASAARSRPPMPENRLTWVSWFAILYSPPDFGYKKSAAIWRRFGLIRYSYFTIPLYFGMSPYSAGKTSSHWLFSAKSLAINSQK